MGHPCRISGPRLFLALLLILSAAPSARSQQSAMDFFVDGVEAYESASYEEAVNSFQKAMELEPDNLEYRYYLGLTYSAQKRYQDALDVFEALVEKDPKNYFKAFFDIAGVYFSQKMDDKVLSVLNRVKQIDPESPRVYIELGYAYRNTQRYEQALESFQKAKELDPELIQTVYYNMAIVYLEMEKFDRAEELFRQAMEDKPNTPLAEHARQAISQVKAAKRARRPLYLASSLTWAYDDNVTLDPLEGIGQRTGLVREKADQFQTFVIRGGYKFVNKKDLEVGTGYSLNAIGYKEFPENNVLGHIPHLYLLYQNSPLFFRFNYEFSYYYTGGSQNGQDNGLFLTFGDSSDSKLRMHGFYPALTIVEPFNLKSDIAVSYQKKDYMDGATPNASHYSGEIIQSYKFPKRDWYPRIGYRYDNEDSEAEVSSYYSQEGQAGFGFLVGWAIFGDVTMRYAKTSYDAFPVEGKRRDKRYLFSFSLSRTFNERFILQLIYNHEKNNSNVDADGIDPFKYRKNIYLASFTWMF